MNIEKFLDNRKSRFTLIGLIGLSGGVWSYENLINPGLIVVSISKLRERSLALGPQPLYVELLTILGGLICFGLLAYFGVSKVLSFIGNRPFISLLVGAFATLVVLDIFRQKGAYFHSALPFDPWRIWIIGLGIPAGIFLFLWIAQYLNGIFQEIWQELPDLEKRIYLVTSVGLVFVIPVLFLLTNVWYTGYSWGPNAVKSVWSIDSGYMMDEMLPNPVYYDLRHPLLGIFQYPNYVLANYTALLFFPSNLYLPIKAALIQITKSQLILWSALALRVITKNRFVYLVYLVSIPTLTFFFAVDKYQLMLFLPVMYCYQILRGRNGNPLLASAILIMPASIFLWLAELVVKNNWKEVLKRGFSLALLGIGMIVASGRVCLLTGDAFNLGTRMLTTQSSSHAERFYAIARLLHSCFVPVDSSVVENNNFIWTDTFAPPGLLTILITVMVIVGMLLSFNSASYRVFTVWTLCSILIFVVISWSPEEAPLFNLYFSWAVIPLFVYAFERIIRKLSLPEKPIKIALLLLMGCINISTIAYIAVTLG